MGNGTPNGTSKPAEKEEERSPAFVPPAAKSEIAEIPEPPAPPGLPPPPRKMVNDDPVYVVSSLAERDLAAEKGVPLDPRRERLPEEPAGGSEGEPESEAFPELNPLSRASTGLIPSFGAGATNSFGASSTNSFGAGATNSFGSTATAFDDYTSPGAQAERSAEYMQAVMASGGAAAWGAAPYPACVPPACWMPMPACGPPVMGQPPWPAAVAGPPMVQPPWPNFAPSAANSMLWNQGMMDGGANPELMEAAAAQLFAAARAAKAAAKSARGEEQWSADSWSEAPPQPRASRTSSGAKGAEPKPIPEEERTTLMLRNIPNDYTRDMLLELLNQEGVTSYNFVYLPIDFRRKAGLGYAFLNLETHEDALRARELLTGFDRWTRFCSGKVMEIAWGSPLQGLKDHIDRYRNSPVMHDNVPDECKPAYFENGKRMPFPGPTKRVRLPRTKGAPLQD